MSKHKRRHFNSQSQVTSKYYQKVGQATIGETAEALEEEQVSQDDEDHGSTDKSIGDDKVPAPAPPRKKEVPYWLKITLMIIIPLIPVILFFWNLSQSVTDTKGDVHNIKEKIILVESGVSANTNEIKGVAGQQNDMKIYLEKILGKFDRLFDNLSFLQKIDQPQISIPAEIKKSRK